MAKTIEQLNKDFEASKRCDEEHFAEQKSNLLLVSGDHYKKVERGLRDRLKDSSLTQQQKIKIVKNHTQKICRRIINGVAALSPDVKCTPANKDEMQDKKAAELYQAVKKYADKNYKLSERREEWTEDFVHIGEVACMVRWDPNKGKLVNYHQKETEQGEPLFLDPMGQETIVPGDPATMQPFDPAPDKTRPVFSGEFVFEKIYGFNLFRDEQAESMDDSPFLIVDKMVAPEDAKALIAEDDPERDEKEQFIQKSSEETFRIFDTNRLEFSDEKGKVHIRYHVFRPSMEYPKGYMYIVTSHGILQELELPFGIWPIAYRGYTRMPTSPRHRSPIKVIRPYQIEINRASSQRIHHQLVHGDDKIITRPGSKATQEATLPGLRQYKAFGDVTHIPGRTGDQFAGYLSETISELYQVMDEDFEEQKNSQVDPVALLYQGVKRAKKYGKQAKVMQAFFEDVYRIYFQLAKEYLTDEHLVQAIGRNEAVNMAEFRGAKDVNVMITLESGSGDAEDMLGRYLFTQNILQYVGKDLGKENLARVLSNMPFANSDQILQPLLQDFKNVENDLLAMDRGEMRPAEPDDEHKVYIKELTHRIKSPDFKQLHPGIQQMYLEKRDQHRQFEAKAVEEMLMAQREAIPMDGNLVKVDMYEMTPDGKQVRATFNDGALKWLRARLDQQGMTQERLAVFSQADQLAVAQQATQAAQQQQMQNQNINQGGLNGLGNEQQQPVPVGV